MARTWPVHWPGMDRFPVANSRVSPVAHGSTCGNASRQVTASIFRMRIVSFSRIPFMRPPTSIRGAGVVVSLRSMMLIASTRTIGCGATRRIWRCLPPVTLEGRLRFCRPPVPRTLSLSGRRRIFVRSVSIEASMNPITRLPLHHSPLKGRWRMGVSSPTYARQERKSYRHVHPRKLAHIRGGLMTPIMRSTAEPRWLRLWSLVRPRWCGSGSWSGVVARAAE